MVDAADPGDVDTGPATPIEGMAARAEFEHAAQPLALQSLDRRAQGLSERTNWSAKPSAISTALSSPSGRYHFGIQLIAPRIANPASLGLRVRSSRARTPAS